MVYVTSLQYNHISIIVLKWESRFILRLKAAKNTNHIKKCFKQNLFEIEFPPKTQRTYIFIFPSSGAAGLGLFQRRPGLKYYNVMKRESRFTLGLNTT